MTALSKQNLLHHRRRYKVTSRPFRKLAYNAPVTASIRKKLAYALHHDDQAKDALVPKELLRHVIAILKEHEASEKRSIAAALQEL